MKELLALKSKFGMADPRTAPGATAEKMACSGTDFLSRVAGEVGTKGRMQAACGTVPAPQQAAQSASPMERAVAALAPQSYSESDIENLVQTITDQIMAAAG